MVSRNHRDEPGHLLFGRTQNKTRVFRVGPCESRTARRFERPAVALIDGAYCQNGETERSDHRRPPESQCIGHAIWPGKKC